MNRRARQQRQLLLLLPVYAVLYANPVECYSFPHPADAVPPRSAPAQISFLSPREAREFNAGAAESPHRISQRTNAGPLRSGLTVACGALGGLGAHGASPGSLAIEDSSVKSAEEAPADLPGAISAAADAAELEAAFAAVVAAAAKSLTGFSTPTCQTSNTNCSASDTNALPSPLPICASPAALTAACESFLSKVSQKFGLKGTREANGVVYAHRGSGGGGKLFVDRQQLLRLRGHQQKGSWSLHFLGTGAMQASASRATSSILFSRGDGSAWLFDCGGGLSPTHAASVSRKNAPEAAATEATAAAATAGLTSRLQQAVALAVAAESIAGEQSDELHQQQARRKRVGVVQRVFVTHLHGDHCLGIPAFLAQIAQDSKQESRHVEIVGPEGLRNLLRCVLHGTSARRLPTFSVVELRAVPHLHHRRSRSIRLPALPPAPSEVSGRADVEPNEDGSYDVYEDAGIHVKAAPIRHLVPCVGYVVSERRSRLRLRADVLDPIIARNARELADVTNWPQLRGEPKAVYRLLSAMEHTGKPFTFPDGSIVGPSDVFAEALEPRKFCMAFDTCDASRLLPFARGCDVLVSFMWRVAGNPHKRLQVHEATMSGVKGTSSKADDSVDPLPPAVKYKGLPGEVSSAIAKARVTAKNLMEPHVQAASAAAFERGHASAAMAGSFAASVGASRLILTHFSQRYRGDAALRSVLTMERVEEEARRAYEIEKQIQNLPPAASPLHVTAAWDGLSLVMPQRPSIAAKCM